MMKERPILFSAPMVRAILDGSKTQTRRIVKAKHLPWLENSVMNFLDGKWNQRPLPYGKPGDRLWVRETWRGIVKISAPDFHFPEFGVARYVPDQAHCHRVEFAADQVPDNEPWRPSIHMPRWASRITLEVVGVRVERLNDISESDALEEGITYNSLPNNGLDPRKARTWYRGLWESINGAGSWEANPWVWVIEFKRIAQ